MWVTLSPSGHGKRRETSAPDMRQQSCYPVTEDSAPSEGQDADDNVSGAAKATPQSHMLTPIKK